MIRLRSQRLHESDWSDIAHQLRTIFFLDVFQPVIRIIREYNAQAINIENATGASALRAALRSGKIQYAKGVFSGGFSSATSRYLKSIGAKFNARLGTFSLIELLAPAWILDEAAAYLNRARAAHLAIVGALDRALEQAKSAQYDIDALRMVDAVDAGWRRSAQRLAVFPVLSAGSKANLSEEYSNNMNLWIKKWIPENIRLLRADVEENALAGYRFDSLIAKVKHRKDVSDSKAKFLARQETGLFMAKFQSNRFIESGVFKYQWSTSHDIRVRPYDDGAGITAAQRRHSGNHRELDGQTFDFRVKAPAKYMSCHNPCNPGEDYLCRCAPIPIVE